MSDSKKWHKCSKCEKTLASYKSLWQHKKTCKFNDNKSSLESIDHKKTCQPFQNIGHKRSCDGVGTLSKNPKL